MDLLTIKLYKMKITKHQKEIIRLIAEEGFTLKHQHKFGVGWWIHKDLENGFMKSIDILKSTAKSLIDNKLVELKKIDKYEHHYYKLTKLGRMCAVAG